MLLNITDAILYTTRLNWIFSLDVAVYTWLLPYPPRCCWIYCFYAISQNVAVCTWLYKTSPIIYTPRFNSIFALVFAGYAWRLTIFPQMLLANLTSNNFPPYVAAYSWLLTISPQMLLAILLVFTLGWSPRFLSKIIKWLTSRNTNTKVQKRNHPGIFSICA